MNLFLEFLEKYDAAIILRREGKIDEARAAMETLEVEFPEEPLIQTALAAWDKKAENIEGAIRYSQKYCELAPNDSFGFSILSSYCIAAGRREEAETALANAQQARWKTG